MIYNVVLLVQTGFSKGPGSQLMLSSLATSKWDMIEEAARHQLNSTEQGTLRYYLNEYQKDQITIEGLVLALSELLNTHAKVTPFRDNMCDLLYFNIWKIEMLLSKFRVLC